MIFSWSINLFLVAVSEERMNRYKDIDGVFVTDKNNSNKNLKANMMSLESLPMLEESREENDENLQGMQKELDMDEEIVGSFAAR